MPEGDLKPLKDDEPMAETIRDALVGMTVEIGTDPLDGEEVVQIRLPPEGFRMIQARAAVLLGRGVGVSTVATLLGCSRTTLYRWLEDEAFARLVMENHLQGQVALREAAELGMTQAIETLCSFAQSGDLSVHERIKAACALGRICANVLTMPGAYARAATHPDGTATAEARGPGARAAVNAQGDAAGATE